MFRVKIYKLRVITLCTTGNKFNSYLEKTYVARKNMMKEENVFLFLIIIVIKMIINNIVL